MKETGEFKVTLTLLEGQDDLTTRTLKLTPSNPISIGRSSKAPIKQLLPKPDNAFINNPVISRNHARLVSMLAPGHSYYIVRLEDEGSMHGTFVNKYKLPKKEARTIATDDVIRFGANVTRGSELYKAPEFHFNIEQLEGLTWTVAPAGTTTMPINLEANIAFKGGYYVPESDSSPAPSCIDDDFGSDFDDDGEDSQSSAPAAERAFSQKPDDSDVVEEVSAKKINPIEIIDEDTVPEVIIVDDALIEVSDSEADSDQDQQEDDEDMDEEEEEEGEISEIYGYEVPSDDENEDAESLIEEAFDAQDSREASVESDDAPSVGDAYRMMTDLLTNHVQQGSCDEDNFSIESNASETGPEEPIQPPSKAIEHEAPIRRLEIDDLLNDNTTNPKSVTEGDQAAVEHLMLRHPCDLQGRPDLMHKLPETRRLLPFGGAFPDPPTQAPALPFGYKLPRPNPFTPYGFGEPLIPTNFDGPPMSTAEHHEHMAETWAPPPPPPPPPPQDSFPCMFNPHQDMLSFNTTKSPAPPVIYSKKRAFDVFENDLQTESQPKPSSFSNSPATDFAWAAYVPRPSLSPEASEPAQEYQDFAASRDAVVDDLPAQDIVAKSVADLAAPSSPSPPPQEIKIDATVVQQPPAKRARLHSAAKTAGTVLASALAGGVATFYALGLAPESLFT